MYQSVPGIYGTRILMEREKFRQRSSDHSFNHFAAIPLPNLTHLLGTQECPDSVCVLLYDGRHYRVSYSCALISVHFSFQNCADSLQESNKVLHYVMHVCALSLVTILSSFCWSIGKHAFSSPALMLAQLLVQCEEQVRHLVLKQLMALKRMKAQGFILKEKKIFQDLKR